VLLAGAVEVNALAQVATAIHSVAVDRTPNLPIERRTLYHRALAARAKSSFYRKSISCNTTHPKS